MSLPDIIFNKGQGGLNRPLPGQDYISALIFYTASLPSGFTTSKNIKMFFQLQDAVNAGILGDYSGATPAMAEYLITNDGATGDQITFSVADIDSTGNLPVDASGNYIGPTLLCKYVRLSTDTTIAILGASIAAAINANTINNGYSATFNTATITITAPKKFGIYLNTATTPLSVTIVGAIAGTITQFSGGVFDPLSFYYYHINRFFITQPGGNLQVGFFSIPGTYNFAEVTTMQTFAKGTLRQIGVYKDFSSAWSEGDLTALHLVCVANDAVHMPLSGLYGADMTATTDISTLPDLSLLTANKSSDIIIQDGGGQGNFLYKTSGKSVSALGAMLGAVALAKVSQSIGWVANFNMSDGTEFEELTFCNGQAYSSAAISQTLLNSLDNKRHVFLRKIVGVDGSYFNQGHTAISVTSDYAFIEDNRTIDKAIRGTYAALVPSLNGPIQLNANGTLSENTVATLEAAPNTNLDAMVRAGEMSAYAIIINPVQYVLQTGQLVVTIEIVQQGVARQIVVNIGFVPQIS